ncbi:cupin domain-containing protein [Agrobacterium vitis]|uniref:Cupin domain-containing protein n=1 Tax=Agrobacterium vitis TaxID=373 RepID=A0A7K1RKH1_AGRVI|nr:cupin domain-containing protein [Agrobacterium vitis]MVA58505.1 cupin domain-containing protein [Agrobacterium vitis]
MIGTRTEKLAIDAQQAAIRPMPPYPGEFCNRLSGRVKRPLGEPFGLTNFGVNLTVLPPGGHSSLHHRHTHDQEFIYVLEGTPTLVSDQGEIELKPGMCAGFLPNGAAHHLENRATLPAMIIEVGDRNKNDDVEYPLDDIAIRSQSDGSYVFYTKDGLPY